MFGSGNVTRRVFLKRADVPDDVPKPAPASRHPLDEVEVPPSIGNIGEEGRKVVRRRIVKLGRAPGPSIGKNDVPLPIREKRRNEQSDDDAQPKRLKAKTAQEYIDLMDRLAAAGDWEGVRECFTEMKATALRPGPVIWRHLRDWCINTGSVAPAMEFLDWARTGHRIGSIDYLQLFGLCDLVRDRDWAERLVRCAVEDEAFHPHLGYMLGDNAPPVLQCAYAVNADDPSKPVNVSSKLSCFIFLHHLKGGRIKEGTHMFVGLAPGNHFRATIEDFLTAEGITYAEVPSNPYRLQIIALPSADADSDSDDEHGARAVAMGGEQGSVDSGSDSDQPSTPRAGVRPTMLPSDDPGSRDTVREWRRKVTIVKPAATGAVQPPQTKKATKSRDRIEPPKRHEDLMTMFGQLGVKKIGGEHGGSHTTWAHPDFPDVIVGISKTSYRDGKKSTRGDVRLFLEALRDRGIEAR